MTLVSLWFFISLTPLPGFFAAQFPDDAAGAELAIKTGVGAGFALVQALLAIPEFHLLALHAGLPPWVMTAFSPSIHNYSLSKISRRGEGATPGPAFGRGHGVPRPKCYRLSPQIRKCPSVAWA